MAVKWEHVGDVESDSSPGVFHKISRTSDGRLGCGCTSYKFSSKANKTCKHVAAYMAGDALDATTSVALSVRVKAGDEIYNVTRRVAFGRI